MTASDPKQPHANSDGSADMELKPTAEDLAAQWISEQKAYEVGDDLPPAIRKVIHMALDEPHALWPILLEVTSQTDDHDVLEILGAGPLEDLITYQGVGFFERIEEQYRQNPAFREALSNVWISSEDKHLIPLYTKLGCDVVRGKPAT